MSRQARRASMRRAVVIGEAWRNLASGTSRASLLAVMFIVLVGGVAVVDARTIIGVLTEAQTFRDSGAPVEIIELAGGVSGNACESLNAIGGVTAAGAIRVQGRINSVTLPSSDIQLFEATPNFLAVLEDAADHQLAAGGVAVSQDVAAALGVAAGYELVTETASTPIRAVYSYPDDGRDRQLSYAAIAAAHPAGIFDACWAKIWPTNQTTANYLRIALIESHDGPSEAKSRQLNTRLGEMYDAASRFDGRATRGAAIAAAGLGLVLGFGGVRLRRLELAAALHAQVSKQALTWQICVETAGWVVLAVTVLMPITGFAALLGNPDPGFEAWLIALRAVLAGAGMALLGAGIAVVMTREKHLFRYFKER